MADPSFDALESGIDSLAKEVPVPEAKYGQLDDLFSQLRYRLLSDDKLSQELPLEQKSQLIRNICNLLRPSTSVIQDEDEEEDEKQPAAARFQELSSTGLSVISTLLDSTQSDAPLVQPLAVAVATYSDVHDPWTCKSSHDTAIRISQTHHFPQETITDILTTTVKPLFTSRPGTITAQGRQAIRQIPKKSFSYMDDAATKPWKTRVETITILSWAVENATEETINAYWNVIVPPLLTLLDENHIPTKTRSLVILQVLLAKVDVDILKRTGLQEVIWDAVVPCLSYLPPITPLKTSKAVIEVAFMVLRKLADIRSIPPFSTPSRSLLNKEEKEKGTIQHERSKYLSVILCNGILRKQSYVSDNVYVQEIYAVQIRSIVKEMGIYAVRHLSAIIQLLSDALVAPFATAYVPLMREACTTLEDVVMICWPRIGEYRVVILRCLTVAWLRIMEEGDKEKEGFKEVKDGMKKCVEVLQEATAAEGGTKELVERIEEKKENVRELFESIL